MRIFVYGTLKRGQCRHQHLAGQTFVAVARTVSKYRMVNVGDYPGLLRDSQGLSIEGEIWDVDAACLARLDVVESVADGEYSREPIELLDQESGSTTEAYFYLRPTVGCPDCGTVWTDG